MGNISFKNEAHNKLGIKMDCDYKYLKVLNEVRYYGEERTDRTGVGTFSMFAPPEITLNLINGFPLLTVKKIHFKSVAEELLWFLSGSQNNNDLLQRGVTIWNGWCDPETGDLGPIYGSQWVNWNGVGIDQISNLVQEIKNNPTSRRLIVSAWNVEKIPEMALPPCHMMFQCYVRKGEYLDMKMYQRSADMFLGVPFNIASYALLLMLLAKQTGLHPGKLTLTFGDAHVYKNHTSQVYEMLERIPRHAPTLVIKEGVKSIFDYKYEDFTLVNYDPHPTIKAPIAV